METNRTTLDWPIELTAALAQLSPNGPAAWLDSSQVDSANAVSVIGLEPLAVLDLRGRRAELRIGERPPQTGDWWRLWRATQSIARATTVDNDDAADLCGFGPGWIGYLGFESSRERRAGFRTKVEREIDLNENASATGPATPPARVSLFDSVVVLNHAYRSATLCSCPQLRSAVDAPPAPAEALRDRWNAACRQSPQAKTPVSMPMPLRATPTLSRQAFEAAVRRAKEYIAAGDIYQVNLAHRIDLAPAPPAFATYVRMRATNPAPFGAFLRIDETHAVASVSPELFLRVRGRDVLTCPIKGTRPRTGDAATDAHAEADLLKSEKDAAELTMIVDLHRNDLGRVCEFGSVRVQNARRTERHPRVIHTVADVTGRLAPGRDAFDLLQACFPAGSISGVPKIRALEIIDELETTSRGVYTGAIGWLGLSGNMTWNVAIRTLQFAGNAAYLHVGGGIVADSDPAAEYQETLDKARGILEALDAEFRELNYQS